MFIRATGPGPLTGVLTMSLVSISMLSNQAVFGCYCGFGYVYIGINGVAWLQFDGENSLWHFAAATQCFCRSSFTDLI
ncbi:hypothetical protein [Paenibacillus sp. IITD108]|uniref:hypothetical protein n=1 Tax=Paenibacillus sp. IITD108 TaxID=3116649 RepID=UPI002F4002CF